MSTTYPIYIQNVFGQDSDALTAFPMAVDPDGAISFDQGYTPPYQYNLITNPEALPINRGQFNYLMNVITANIQQYQQKGTPAWIDPSQNGGINFPYVINAQVFYGGNIYRNLVAANTAVPGTDDTWLNISTNVDGMQVGFIIAWPTFGSPAGNYLFCDGSAISRTTYADLFGVICPILTGNVTNTSNQITSLSSTTDIRIGCPITATGFIAGTVVTAIVNSTTIQVSNSATSSQTGENVQFFPNGIGDGSTTFNLPGVDGKFIAGAGGSGIAWAGETYKGVAATLGNEDYQLVTTDLPNHTHDAPFPSVTDGFLVGVHDGSGAFGSVAGNGTRESLITGNITGYTSQTNIPQIPPAVLYKFFIKYQ